MNASQGADPRPRIRRRAIAVALGGLLLVAAVFAVAALIAARSGPDSSAADPVVAAAGDIACDPGNRSFRDGNGSARSCRQQAVSDLLVDAGLAAVFPLGDLQYHCGSDRAFQESYDRSWGRVKDITVPVVGNHEYLAKGRADATGATSAATGCDASNTGAAGYFDYFGEAAGDPAKGYRSLDIGAWHVVVLNSSCRHSGGCGPRSPQVKWLADDLAANPRTCTMALFHHPRFSSGRHGDNEDYVAFWATLHAAGVDVVLNGHDHIYERFAAQTPSGAPDPEGGIRQFTVGTGGANHTDVTTVRPNSEVHNDTTFGVLKLTLHPSSYDWAFVPEAGEVFTDTGTGECH